MSKVLRYRLENAPATNYAQTKFPEVEEQSADIANATGLFNITAGASLVLWNDRLEDRAIPVYKGFGTKLVLHSNEFIVITTGSEAETLYYFAASDDADVYCNTAEAFVAAGGVIEGVTEIPASEEEVDNG